MDLATNDSAGKDRPRGQRKESLRKSQTQQKPTAIRQRDTILVKSPNHERTHSRRGTQHTYRQIIETMNEAALTVGLDGAILFCNQRFCDLVSASKSAILGAQITSLAPGAQRRTLQAILIEAQVAPVRRHLTLRTVNGTAVSVLLSASLLQGSDSASICLVASDLTELEDSANSIRTLREQQQALEVSEERLRQAAQAAHFGVYRIDFQNGHVYWSPQLRQILGLADDAPTVEKPESVPDFVHPDEVERVQQLMEASRDPAGDGLFQTEHRVVRPDGSVRWVMVKGQVQFEGQGRERHAVLASGIMLDITERKEVEAALRESEERYRDLFESMGEGFCIIEMIFDQNGKGVDYRFLRTNPAFVKQTGLRDVQGKRMRELVPDLNTHWFETAGKIALTGEPTRLDDYASELSRWYDVYAFRVGRSEDRHVAVLFNDITERKEAEAALRQSEQRFRALTAASSEVMYRMSPDWKVMYQLQARGFLAEAKGHGSDWPERYIPSEEWPRVQAAIKEAIRTKDVFELEHRVHKADGSIGWAFSRAIPLLDDEGEIIEWFGAASDITARKETEESLRTSKKSLEELVAERTAELEERANQLQALTLELSQAETRERQRLAEILHDDLQQQLAGTKFHVGLLARQVKKDPDLYDAVRQIEAMIKEAIEKSRGLSHELSPAILHQGTLPDALVWLGAQMQAKHGLTVSVNDEGWVESDCDSLRAFLYQASRELLFNVVKHACVKGAKVRLRRLGQCLCVSISDAGCGFDPQTLKATKGFGLLSIRERVQLLGGRMKIKSTPGAGSTFVIALEDNRAVERRAQKAVTIVSQAPRPTETRGGKPVRVLLADDHEIVREGLLSTLAGHSDVHVVGQATNGQDAIDQTRLLRPDVVVMDVSMPGMNGDAATEQIKRELPATRIVALSMYDEKAIGDRMREAGAECYLLKTAPGEEILAAIRGEVLS